MASAIRELAAVGIDLDDVSLPDDHYDDDAIDKIIAETRRVCAAGWQTLQDDGYFDETLAVGEDVYAAAQRSELVKKQRNADSKFVQSRTKSEASLEKTEENEQ